MTWQQPNTEQLEERLSRHLARFNAWRTRIATHYPATLRGISAGITALLVVASIPLMLSIGAPLGIALTVGPVFALIVGVLLAMVLIALLFDPPYGSKCKCGICKGDLR